MKQDIKRKLTREEKSFAIGLGELVKHAQGRKATGIHMERLPQDIRADDVKAFRKQMRLSQSQCAVVLKVKPETVKKWEQGSNPVSGPAGQWIRAAQLNQKYVEELFRELLAA